MPNHILPQTPRRRRFLGVAAADAAVAHLPDACLRQMAGYFAGQHPPYRPPGTPMVDAEMLEHGAGETTDLDHRGTVAFRDGCSSESRRNRPAADEQALASFKGASALSRHAVC